MIKFLLQIFKNIFFGRMAKAAEKTKDLESDELSSEADIVPEQKMKDTKPEPKKETDDAKNKFDDALKLVLRYEGDYVNHPNDPGGATNKGITQAVYDKYRKNKHKAVKDVRNINDDEINNIYFENYWLKAKCNKLPENLSIVHFDTAVNSGIKQASKFLQRSVGANDDGIIGEKTLKKIKDFLSEKNENMIIKNYLTQRRAFYKLIAERNPKLKVFLRGWFNRLAHLETYIDSQTRLA